MINGREQLKRSSTDICINLFDSFSFTFVFFSFLLNTGYFFPFSLSYIPEEVKLFCPSDPKDIHFMII